MRKRGGGVSDDAAEAVFLAGLPIGPKGDLIPGHTTWDDLGPKAKERYQRMARAAGIEPTTGGLTIRCSAD